jgi:hypothetical protein
MSAGVTSSVCVSMSRNTRAKRTHSYKQAVQHLLSNTFTEENQQQYQLEGRGSVDSQDLNMAYWFACQWLLLHAEVFYRLDKGRTAAQSTGCAGCKAAALTSGVQCIEYSMSAINVLFCVLLTPCAQLRWLGL